MPQFIKISSTNHFNLRSAIRAALNGQSIDIDTGFYDIRSSAISFTALPDPTKLRNPNTFACFGTKTLTFSGSGSGKVSTSNTIITGNARIYTAQSDRGSGVPVGSSINSLRLSYGQTFNGDTSRNGSGYVLQSGVKVYTSGSLRATPTGSEPSLSMM
jgi:hypothetical protein